jgi:hypothetical protein
MSQKFFRLFATLVPESGQAATVQGELVRAIGRMADEFAKNGFANWDAGYERLSTFALRHLTDGTFGPQTTAGVRTDIDHIQAYGRGADTGGYDLESAFDRLMQAAATWCERHLDPVPHSPDAGLTR